jgi:hypothetical protein
MSNFNNNTNDHYAIDDSRLGHMYQDAYNMPSSA